MNDNFKNISMVNDKRLRLEASIDKHKKEITRLEDVMVKGDGDDSLGTRLAGEHWTLRVEQDALKKCEDTIKAEHVRISSPEYKEAIKKLVSIDHDNIKRITSIKASGLELLASINDLAEACDKYKELAHLHKVGQVSARDRKVNAWVWELQNIMTTWADKLRMYERDLEIREAGSVKSKQELARLANGKKITLERNKQSRYT